MTSGTTETILEVWGSSGSDVFAVGSFGNTFNYDGTNWSAITSGAKWTLFGVWGSSASDVFAVGWAGDIVHYDGNPSPTSTTTTAGSATTTTTSPSSTFTIGGTITGTVSDNVSVELMGAASQMGNTDSSGYYEFTNLTAGGQYIIIPQLAGYVFDPPEHVIASLTSDELNRDFISSVAPLCPTEVIYGEDSEEVELLRALRDEVLSKTPEGREIIKQYYMWSPLLVEAVEEDIAFREEARDMIEEVLMMMR
jgi:hypothetical protein